MTSLLLPDLLPRVPSCLETLCLMLPYAATRGQKCLAGAKLGTGLRTASLQSKGPNSEMVGLYYAIRKQMCWLSYPSLSS